MSKFCLLTLVFTAIVWGQEPTCPSSNVSACINSQPTREFGQPALLRSLNSIAPNLVEGRELYRPYSIAFDTSVTPNILYIVDSLNNRVLGYQNPSGLTPCLINNPTCGFANLVIGPRPGDRTTTLPGGPTAPSPGVTAGVSFPLAATVDSSGNLYVLDSGNNRIVRYPAPAKQTGALWNTDLVIGQRSIASGTSPNQGLATPSATSLFFSSNGTALNASLTIEPTTGALWVTDPGNNRVLRFPVSQLAANTSLPQADLVIGQSNFTTQAAPTPPAGTPSQLFTSALYQPAGITFDNKDGLYVADGVSGQFFRVMYYAGGYGIGVQASRILGLDYQLTSTPLTYPNNYALVGPVGLAVSPSNNLWVADTADSRIVEYDVPANWPSQPVITPNQNPPSQVSPPMLAVLGQPTLTTTCPALGCANKGQARPDNTTLSSPFGIAFNGTDLWVADTFNNRVLDFPQQSGGYSAAAHLAGQVDYPYNSPNLIEGREVDFASGLGVEGINLAGGGMAVDRNSNPPHLYVADTANNRILCFNDLRSNPSKADLVLGQTDFYSALFNSPLNDPTTMTQSGLSFPTDVAVDANGNVWVADLGNGRVVRYPAPFSQPTGTQILPTVVLGQQSFIGTAITDASIETMASPFGLAIFSNGSLAVSDATLNRILIFTKPAGGDFQNSQSASVVLGQSNFNTGTTGTGLAALYSPRHMSVDTSDRLYVADPGNNRVLVYANGYNSTTGEAANLQLSNFSAPQGVQVSALTGEVWVANTNSGALYRLPEFESLNLNPNQVTATIQTQTAPYAVQLDNSNNVIIAEQANRVTFYYALLAYQHPANYNTEPLSPGQLALLYLTGPGFNFTPSSAVPPLPTTLGDIQVQVNGVPAPMYEVNQIDVAFQVPSSTPPSGTANFVMIHPSTGEIIGTVPVPMQQFNPGFFANPSLGYGQAAAVNNGIGAINGPSNPIPVGGSNFVSFYLTGGGPFPGIPDGQVGTTTVNTSVMPVIIAGNFSGANEAPASEIKYSGSSFFPGVWQINFLIDSSWPPGCTNNIIVVQMGGTASNVGPSGQPASANVFFCVSTK